MTRNRAGAGLGVLLAALAVGCAKKAPPSGGPPDLTPPRVVASVPDSGSAGVPTDVALSITFSEAMEPRSTGAAVDLAPRIPIRAVRWKGSTMRVELAEPLAAERTYTLFVGGGARDRHGNALVGGATVTFSTSDSFPPGMLEGTLEARGLSAAGIYLWCYAEGREPDSTARDFDALALADRDGRFRVPGLPVPGRYRLWAFADLNANRSFEPRADVLAAVDTTFSLTEEAPVARDLALLVVNPRAPAVVRGAVLDSLADTLGVVRVIAVSRADTTKRLAATVATDGAFEVNLEPGAWRLEAWRDLDGNRRFDRAREPASEPVFLDLAPAAVVTDVRLVLAPPPAGTEDP